MAAGQNGQVEEKQLTIVEKATIAQIDRDVFTTAMGVRLQLRPIPAQKINAARDNVPRPTPPRLAPKTDDPNEPWIENHAHPDYVKAMDEYNRIRQDIGTNIMFWEGTSVIDVPEGMFRPEEDGWIDSVEDVDLMGPYAPKVRRDNPKLRYIDYLQYYGMADADYAVLANHMTRWAGEIQERDVTRAMEDSFRGNAERGANPGVRPAPASRK